MPFSGKGEALMADDQKSTSGEIPGFVQEFIAQVRAATDGLAGLTAFGQSRPSVPALPSLPGLPMWPAPGALSAAQLKSTATSIAAQRRSIEALKTQLTAFDEQLAVVERVLEPLTEWSRTWADMEERMTKVPGGSEPTGQADGSAGAGR